MVGFDGDSKGQEGEVRDHVCCVIVHAVCTRRPVREIP